MKSGLVPSLMTAMAIGSLGATVLVSANDEQPRATASMHELMTAIIQPTSDAVFYISRTPPQDDADWLALERQTLMLAESANLLLIPGYRVGTEQWIRDSLLMRDASVRAYQAAKSRDMDTLIDLNNDLYMSCENCHDAIR
jgi:hypothetical protein